MFQGSLSWLKALDWQREVAHVFAIDLRSIALSRILVGLIILGDLALRAPDIARFYGDGGVLPTNLVNSFWTGEWAWSLHVLFGGPTAFVAALFILHALSAIALTLGFQTRVVTVINWVLLVSLQNANPLINLGGDFLLRAIVFVGMFLPWGEFFSVDRALSRKPATRVNLLSPWSAAFLIQMALLYFFASMFKNGIEWNVTGSALYYIASIDQYATWFSKFILNFPLLLQFFTLAITAFQHVVVFLLFFPFLNKYIRTITALILIFMHLVFALASYLGIFSWVAIAGLVAFFPSLVWDGVSQVLAGMKDRWSAKIRSAIAWYVESPQSSPQNAYIRAFTRTLWGLGVLYIVYIFLWQAADFVPLARTVPSWDAFSVPAKVLRIDQRWNLFAPRPYVNDGWDILRGTLADGSVVDLQRGGAPISYEKPDDVYAIYGNTHRREYTLEIRRPYNDEYRLPYARYLCRTWNASHEGAERLVSIELIFMLEQTPAPGYAPQPLQEQSLFTWRCE